MYYYAVLDPKDLVESVESSLDQVIASNYIDIPSEDTSLIGKWYDRYGRYGVEGAFIDAPIHALAKYSTDEINYRNQDVWLSGKLDTYATIAALDNYALVNHYHSPDSIGAALANHSHSSATIDSDGFMSYEDKIKLNGIDVNANNYSHPSSHAASMIIGLADVATSGSYNDLSNKPSIPVIPSSLPANGGNADTIDNCHASDFASANHNHAEEYADISHNHDEAYSDINHTHSNATANAAGFMSSNDKTKLNGIAAGANCYTHPNSHSLSMITETDGLKVMTAAERAKLSGIAENANNYTHPETHSAGMIEETSLKKIMTAEERTKLAGIAEGANNYSHPASHPASIITGLSEVATSGSYDDLEDKPTSMAPTAHTHAQSDITGLASALNGKAATGHTHAAASTSAAGFMSSSDKTKLNGIATGANNYTHPATHAASMITGLANVATSGSYNDLSNKPTIPTTLPANGGNADTVDNCHASDFATASHTHSQYATVTALNAIWSAIYPVGSIYMSVSSTSPATLFGGTWAAFGQGRVLVGVESGGTAGTTGGSSTASIAAHYHTTQGHVLTTAEMPSHHHELLNLNTSGISTETFTKNSVKGEAKIGWTGNVMTSYTGGDQSHSHGNTGNAGAQSISIVQPYVTCYMWKRTN